MWGARGGPVSKRWMTRNPSAASTRGGADYYRTDVEMPGMETASDCAQHDPAGAARAASSA